MTDPIRPMSPKGRKFDATLCDEIKDRIQNLARLGSRADPVLLDKEAREISRKAGLILSNQAWWADKAAYQRSDIWQAKRQQKLRATARKQHRGAKPPLCEHCGAREATAVHHLSYERAGPGRWGKERLGDLECLCQQCHDALHEEIER